MFNHDTYNDYSTACSSCGLTMRDSKILSNVSSAIEALEAIEMVARNCIKDSGMHSILDLVHVTMLYLGKDSYVSK